MKKHYERIFIRIFTFSVFFIFSLFITGCNDEPVDDTPSRITGTWHQISQSKAGVAIAKDSTRMILQINSNQICVICDSTKAAVTANKVIKRSGWSYTGGLFNLAIDIPVSWTPVITDEQLTLEKIEFSPSGTLVKTSQVYQRVANLVID